MRRDQSDLWFIAYDIRNPQRLRRVHRCVRTSAVALQYSAFCFEGHERALMDLLTVLESIIDPAVDDVRAYRLPHSLKVWKLGCQGLPDGVMVTGSPALMALMQVSESETATGILANGAGPERGTSEDADVYLE
jgi:CRISPR-associated protein Cas2